MQDDQSAPDPGAGRMTRRNARGALRATSASPEAHGVVLVLSLHLPTKLFDFLRRVLLKNILGPSIWSAGEKETARHTSEESGNELD